MPDRTIAIAPIRLAHAWRRLLAPSLILLVVAGVAAAGGVTVGGLPGIGLIGAGGVVGVLALYLALMVLRLRLEVEVATLHLRWPGGERRYALARGPVTRVATRGEGAVRIRARFGAFGWAVGPARMRNAERIEVVRLAPTGSLILVPTDQGRLGIAAASESELIAALGAAARVQQRLDAAAAQARATAVPLLRSPEPPLRPPPPAPSPPPPEPHYMTGIERARLEERLRAERAAALAAAEAERRAAEQAALEAATADLAAAPDTVSAEPRPSRRPVLRRPALRRPAVARPSWARARPLPPVPGGAILPLAVAALPAFAAGIVWIVAVVMDLLPTGDALRPMALATVLAAAGLLGALVAARWFPRLTGLVSISSLVALVLIGRAIFG